MRRNLAICQSIVDQSGKWPADERVTRARMVACLAARVYLLESMQLNYAARKPLLAAQEPSVAKIVPSASRS